MTFSHSHVVKVQGTHKPYERKYCSFLFPKKLRYQILISLKSTTAGSSKVEGGNLPSNTAWSEESYEGNVRKNTMVRVFKRGGTEASLAWDESDWRITPEDIIPPPFS